MRCLVMTSRTEEKTLSAAYEFADWQGHLFAKPLYAWLEAPLLRDAPRHFLFHDYWKDGDGTSSAILKMLLFPHS